MVGVKFRLKKRKPDWLSDLLRSKFFGSCVDHPDLRKNDKNVFCIHCSRCICRHCISSSAHRLHTWLQICKYVYHDVIRLQDIQKHLDCSEIQTYKINGEKAIHLNPRPQSKDSKPSTKTKCGASCEACGRYIQDVPNRFCSIACKVLVFSEKSDDESNKIISFPIPEVNDLYLKEESSPNGDTNNNESPILSAESSEEAQAFMDSALKPKRQLHKRKGIPSRAPFS